MTGTLPGIFGILTVCAVALAGCGGVATTEDTAPDGKPTGDIIVGATEDAESARISLTLAWEWSDDERQPQRDTSAFEGVIDFTADRGSMKDVTPPPPPTTTTTAPPGLEAGASVSISGRSGRGSEYRWIGSTTYSHSSGGERMFGMATKPWTAIDQAVVAEATECPLDGGSTGAMFGAEGSAATVLDELRADGGRLTEAGTENVRGVETTRWRVQLPDAPSDDRCDSNRVKSDVAEYSVWTDADGRARRVKSVVTMEFLGDEDFPGDTTTKTTTTMTTEFFDFGTPVAVEAPPADQVTDLTDAMAMMMRGPGTVDDDAWTRAARGTSDGEPWTIWFAESSTEWRCYDLENLPDDFGISYGDDDSETPKHNGRTADCQPSSGSPMFGAAFNVWLTESIGVDRVRMYGSVGGTGIARVRFPDGTEEQLRADPNTRIAVWEGATPQERTHVELDDGTRCRLDDDSSFDDIDSFEHPCGHVSIPFPKAP